MTLESLVAEIKVCPKCPLCKSRTLAVPGEGNPKAKLIIIGEAPGADEDREGRPFVGKASEILNFSLEKAGLNRDEIFITNVVKCHPPENRAPHKEEIKICTENYLFNQIQLVDPKALLLLGRVATKVFFPKNQYLAELFEVVSEWNERKVFVYYHPALALHRPNMEYVIRDKLAEKLIKIKESLK
jgi:DNA polymerase